MANKVRLKSVEIEGFRGHSELAALDFEKNVVLLHGEIGAGKTSTIGAVEWALFGDFAPMVRHEGKTKEDLISLFNNRIKVGLTLTTAEGSVELVRDKPRAKMQSSLRLTLPSGKAHEGNDAESQLFRLLGTELQGFTTSVYLHQEAIRGIITEDPAVRDEALDMLFGLEEWRNIAACLTPKPFRDAVASVQTQQTALHGKLQARLQEAQRALEEAGRKAAVLGVAERDYNLVGGSRMAGDAVANLGRLCEAIGLEAPAMPRIESRADLSQAALTVDGHVRRAKTHLPEQRRMTELANAEAIITDVQAKYSSQATRTLTVETELREFIKQHGDEKGIGAELKKTTEKLHKLREGRGGLDARQKVAKDAIDLLKQTPEIEMCPVCGKSMKPQEVLAHLERELTEEFEKRIEKVDAEIAKTRKSVENLGDLLKEFGRLRKEREEQNRKLNTAREKASELLKRPLKATEDVARLLEEARESVKTEKARLLKPLREREKVLGEIESRIKEVEAVADVIARRERCELLQGMADKPELTKGEDTIKDLALIEGRVGRVAEAVRRLLTTQATQLVSVAMPQIRAFYSELCDHPYFDELEITAEPLQRGGTVRNTYQIKGKSRKDGQETLVEYRLSTGQLTCVALSIVLALAHAGVATHNLGFLILDDPSQNLDRQRKKKLAGLIAGAARSRQVVICTQDAEFVEDLGDAVPPTDLQRYQFGRWEPKGPVFQRAQ